MEEITYTNIFATKGIEYIIIIAFFLTLIPFRMLMKKKKSPALAAVKSPGVVTANTLRIPQGIFFSRFHTWAHLHSNGAARVGLDDFLIHLTGDVQLTQLKQPGVKIRKGEILAQVNHNGKSLNVLSPVSGEVMDTNTSLEKEPELMQVDPYEKGWIYSIKPSAWKEETSTCFLAEDATSWAVQELDRFKDFLAVSTQKSRPEPVGVVMQDGGELIENPLDHMPQEVWKDFQKNFLSKE